MRLLRKERARYFHYVFHMGQRCRDGYRGAGVLSPVQVSDFGIYVAIGRARDVFERRTRRLVRRYNVLVELDPDRESRTFFFAHKFGRQDNGAGAQSQNGRVWRRGNAAQELRQGKCKEKTECSPIHAR